MSVDGNLRPIFRQKLTKMGFHCQSIETGSVGRGIPDMEYCSPEGISGWTEFKLTHGWSVNLSPEQIGWILQRRRANGRAFVCVRRKCNAGKRRKAADELWILDGAYADIVKEHGLKCKELPVLGIWTDGPAKWDWGAIRAIITAK